MTSKPITDQAEVSIDFPEKFYHGSFGPSSRYDVTADAEGVHIHLRNEGAEKRHVGFHIHYYLLADLIADAAGAAAEVKDMQPNLGQKLREAGALWQKLGTD